MSLATGIGLVILGTIIGAFGPLLLKKGAAEMSLNPLKIIKNHMLLAGIALYGLSIIPFVIALRFGDVSTLYPFVSLSYIWVMILSVIYLKEKMNKWKYIGVASIIIGVVLIGLGG